MRVQLQAVSLRMQTLRSNEQMASAMKGATRVSWEVVTNIETTVPADCVQAMGQMNRSLNLPQVSRVIKGHLELHH